MRSEDDVVDALRRAHRLAADQVDERPDPSVRAAVIAAAARAVDANSRSTVQPPRGAPFATRRWPLSAAAVLTVSVMTALIASQVLRDEPERITTIASPTPLQQPQQPQQAEAVAAPDAPATAPSLDERRISRQVESKPTQKVVPPAPKREAVARPRAFEPEARADANAELPVRAAPPRSPTPLPLPLPSSVEALDRAKSAVAGDVDAARTPRDERAAVRTEVAPTAALASAPLTARRQVGRAAEPASAEAWVERIVRLRAEGHDAEADRELEGLRRRYPGFEVPAAALTATGTR